MSDRVNELKKGTGTFCRNGAPGASHKRFLSPFANLAPQCQVSFELLGDAFSRRLVVTLPQTMYQP